MALDGIVLSNIVYELNELLVGGRIDKITQPEKDEIVLFIRSNRNNYKLLMSAEAGTPRIHLTEQTRNNPMTAPSFCMILRKYLGNGKILGVKQPNSERIAEVYIEHLNEMGDICYKILIIEVMGRHSNIILCDSDYRILDSIRHVTHEMSSVREVLPGFPYKVPPAHDKISIFGVTSIEQFSEIIQKPIPIQKSLYESFIGLSPVFAEELCYRSNVQSDRPANTLTSGDFILLYDTFSMFQKYIQNAAYEPVLIMDADSKGYTEFHSFRLLSFTGHAYKTYDSVSKMLDDFYEAKSNASRLSQKSFDIRRIIKNNIERCSKKLSLQSQQLKDTEDMEKYKIKGELIHGNLYHLHEGDSMVSVLNYYTGETEDILLDPNLSPSQNAVRYYNKYNKKKRTYIAVSELMKETEAELAQLESISFHLEMAEREEDLLQIRSELMEGGYIRFKKAKDSKNLKQSKPLHYLSSDGFHIYVGKNNIQNEELSTKFAGGNDWWFHAKGIPGSHVIVKTEGRELTDLAYEEAGALAAFYSKGRNNSKVEIDYTQKKNLKKTPNSLPGYFIYHTNFSLLVEPKENHLQRIE